nr:MAG TPA: hypothetical protein [Bacteriophage sp.]
MNLRNFLILIYEYNIKRNLCILHPHRNFLIRIKIK